MKVQNLKIIIADSSLATNLKLKIQLDKLGCQVAATTDNAFRLQYLVEKLKPDFIILDTGLLNPAAEKYLKKSQIPILFTTCYGVDELLFSLFEKSNTVGYLVKPIDRFSLYSSIRGAISFHHNYQRGKQVEL